MITFFFQLLTFYLHLFIICLSILTSFFFHSPCFLFSLPSPLLSSSFSDLSEPHPVPPYPRITIIFYSSENKETPDTTIVSLVCDHIIFPLISPLSPHPPLFFFLLCAVDSQHLGDTCTEDSVTFRGENINFFFFFFIP